MMKKMASWKVGAVAALAMVALLFIASPVKSRKVRTAYHTALIPEAIEAAFLQEQKSTISKDLLEKGLREPLKLVYCKELVLGKKWDVGKVVKVTGRGWRNKKAPVTINVFPEKPATEKRREALDEDPFPDEESSGKVEQEPGASEATVKNEDEEAAEDVKSAQAQFKDYSEEIDVPFFFGRASSSSMASKLLAGLHEHFVGHSRAKTPAKISSGTDSDKATAATVNKDNEAKLDLNGETETAGGWNPILQIVIERSPIIESGSAASASSGEPKPPYEEVFDLKKLQTTSGTESGPNFYRGDMGQLKDFVEREEVNRLLVTGPFTCSVYTVSDKGEHHKQKSEKTPMISDESGFMAVMTRTPTGYEMSLYGWEKSGWKLVHFDNVPVDQNIEPKLIRVDENSSVNSLRYYVSDSIPADFSECKDPSGGRSDDCHLTEWSEWTSCSTSCGRGEQHRIRSVQKEATGLGSCDLPLTEFKMCNLDNPCSNIKDCRMSSWTPWSECSVTCGEGEQSQTRTIVQQPGPGGLPCGVQTNTKKCQKAPC